MGNHAILDLVDIHNAQSVGILGQQCLARVACYRSPLPMTVEHDILGRHRARTR
jgi:hypothetical protein